MDARSADDRGDTPRLLSGHRTSLTKIRSRYYLFDHVYFFLVYLPFGLKNYMMHLTNSLITRSPNQAPFHFISGKLKYPVAFTGIIS